MKKNTKVKNYLINYMKKLTLLISCFAFLLSSSISKAHPGPEPHDDLPRYKKTQKKRSTQYNVNQSKNSNQQFLQNKLGIDCKVTPSLEASFKPVDSKINKHGNLYRKTGSAYTAKGTYTIIRGVVRDEECLPISNALIEIWQRDSAGKYDKDYQTKTKWDTQDKDFDPHFAYTGSAQTNNLGQFTFLTIMPKAAKNSAPHLNVNIEHNKFKNLETRLFFNKVPKKAIDKKLKELSSKKRASLVMEKAPNNPNSQYLGYEYSTVITLGGIHSYKEY